MIALTLTNLSKSYGLNTILQDISLTVQGGDKIGIVGPNGAGKSTLLRILAGEIPPSSGSTFVNRALRLGYLRQEKTMADTGGEGGGTTVFDTAWAAYTRLTEKGMELFESEVRGVLIGLGFEEEDLQKPATALSGGERARLDIALLLLGKPHILLLDEPTNHLDLKGLAWLEGRIRAFRGTVLMITHDRYFLDRTVNRICELDSGTLTSYGGGFENYRAEKRARMEAEARAYEKASAEFKRQEEMIRQFRQHKTEKLAKRAASREKKLAREGAPLPPSRLKENRAAKIDFAPAKRSGDDVLFAENLSMTFSADTPPLFTGVGLEMKRGEKVCMIGANGIGKTTLLKILAGRSEGDTGETVHGIKVQIGYYDQHQDELSGDQNLLEEMRDCLPAWDDTDLRNLLGQFLFQGEKVFQEISSLSGGEKARLALLKLIVSGANTLLLDEPTNHLDIPSMEAIEEALLRFDGTLLIVTHDRYLLERIPERILELTASGLTSYLGNFQDYLTKKQEEERGNGLLTSEGSSRPRSEGAERYLRAKAEEAARRKRENRLIRLEESIHTLETAIEDLKKRQLNEDAATDYALLSSLQAEIGEKERELEQVFFEWETLSDTTD